MKLYVVQSGVIHTEKNNIVAGSAGVEFNIPVPYFIIEHEKGYVLFDSGFNHDTLVDAKNAVPAGIYEAFNPKVFSEGYVLNALNKIGIKPEDIVYHICSHLHWDHTGGIGLFPNATYVVQRQELHYAYVPAPFMKMAYFRQDFDMDVNWLLLDGWNDHKYDLFNDGKLIIYFTPGHTPGHQSLLVNLDESPPMMLTQDACFTKEILDNYTLPGLACDNVAFINNIMMFRDMQKRGVEVIAGHDPEGTWPSIKKFPEFYM